MSGRILYYISRAAVAVLMGGLVYLIGGPWWMALAIGGAALLFFAFAPVSGRYVVSGRGANPLRRDERAQAIANQASRNGFIAAMLGVSALVLYFGVIAPGDVPVYGLGIVLGLGMLTYFASDVWLRRG